MENLDPLTIGLLVLTLLFVLGLYRRGRRDLPNDEEENYRDFRGNHLYDSREHVNLYGSHGGHLYPDKREDQAS